MYSKWVEVSLLHICTTLLFGCNLLVVVISELTRTQKQN